MEMGYEVVGKIGIEIFVVKPWIIFHESAVCFAGLFHLLYAIVGHSESVLYYGEACTLEISLPTDRSEVKLYLI